MQNKSDFFFSYGWTVGFSQKRHRQVHKYMQSLLLQNRQFYFYTHKNNTPHLNIYSKLWNLNNFETKRRLMERTGYGLGCGCSWTQQGVLCENGLQAYTQHSKIGQNKHNYKWSNCTQTVLWGRECISIYRKVSLKCASTLHCCF